MSDYKSKVNSYNTPNGVKWRVEYAYKTPDGVYHRSCKRGFDSKDLAEKWEKRELYRLIDEKEKEKPPVIPAAPVAVVPVVKSAESSPITTMTMDELIKLRDPKLYTGRCPEQVDAFLTECVRPLIEAHKDDLAVSEVELKV